MRGLKYHGFTEAKVEKRKMTFAELCLYMIDVLDRKPSNKIKVVDITSGDQKAFESVRDILECSWCKDFELEVIGMPHTYGDTAIVVIQSLDDGFRLI